MNLFRPQRQVIHGIEDLPVCSETANGGSWGLIRWGGIACLIAVFSLLMFSLLQWCSLGSNTKDLAILVAPIKPAVLHNHIILGLTVLLLGCYVLSTDWKGCLFASGSFFVQGSGPFLLCPWPVHVTRTGAKCFVRIGPFWARFSAGTAAIRVVALVVPADAGYSPDRVKYRSSFAHGI